MTEIRDKRATILDLARHAGVSKSTVSLVLNNSPLVVPDKRARVEAAIAALGYVYNRTAASLRARPTDVIGMVINDLGNPFFADMALGIEREAARHGVTPFIANTGEDLARQAEVARAMFERGAVGFIMSPTTGTLPADLMPMIAWGVPVVLAARAVRGRACRSWCPTIPGAPGRRRRIWRRSATGASRSWAASRA